MSDHQLHAQVDESQPKRVHCWRYGFAAGDCRRLRCQRCGTGQIERLRQRVAAAAGRHVRLYFVTIYFDYRRFPDYGKFGAETGDKQWEGIFKNILKKVMRVLRDLARTSGAKLEYVSILALGKFSHRIHKHAHSHMLVNWWGVDIVAAPTKRHTERVKSLTIDARMKALGFTAWVEEPRSMGAVVRYMMQNLESSIGKDWAMETHLVRFSQGFEK